MSDTKPRETADVTLEVPENKKTLKESVLDGLEEKGAGKDLWLW